MGGMDDLVLWAMIFFALGAVLLISDAFIPSAGLLSIAGMGCIVLGVVLMWLHDGTAGLIATAVVAVLLPVGIGLMFHYLPDTPLARHLSLRSEASKTPEPITQSASLLGCTGEALTDLRPVGTCLLDKRRIPCRAQSGVIQRGQRVKVVHADAFEVVVREA